MSGRLYRNAARLCSQSYIRTLSGVLVGLCNELGEGRGHFARLAPIGEELRRRGYRIRYFAAEPDLARAVGIAPSDIEGVPHAATSVAEGTAVTFGEAVARTIYGSSESVTAQIAAWSAALEGADLIVADYSPSALVASRGRRPRIALGNGFTMPPANIPFYPRLWRKGPGPVHDERRVAADINSALAALGISPIANYPEVMAAERRFVFSVPPLDPYDGLRNEPLYGSLHRVPPPSDDKRRDCVFAYFRGRWARDPRLVAALSTLREGRFVLAGATPEARAIAARGGSVVTDVVLPLAEVLPRTRLIVHYGGGALVLEALLAGIPQIILATDIEKHLNGAKLAERGAARVLDWRAFTAAELGDCIAECRDDAEMRKAANTVAVENAAFGRGGGVELVARAVDELLA